MYHNLLNVEKTWGSIRLRANAEVTLGNYCYFLPQMVEEWDDEGKVVPVRSELPVVGSVYFVGPSDEIESRDEARLLMFAILDVLRRRVGVRVFFTDTATFLNTLMPPQELRNAIRTAVKAIMSGELDSESYSAPARFFDDDTSEKYGLVHTDALCR